jgi:hypothetical protein
MMIPHKGVPPNYGLACNGADPHDQPNLKIVPPEKILAAERSRKLEPLI